MMYEEKGEGRRRSEFEILSQRYFLGKVSKSTNLLSQDKRSAGRDLYPDQGCSRAVVFLDFGRLVFWI
jgi:hypothetical protein